MSFLGRRTKILIEPYFQQIRFGLVFLLLNFIFSTLVLGVLATICGICFLQLKKFFAKRSTTPNGCKQFQYQQP